MRFERHPGDTTAPRLGVWVGGLSLLGAAAATAWLRLGLPRPGCTFLDWTGLPCATCGSTRMIETLLSGDVFGAAAWNPFVFAFLTFIAIWSAGSATNAALGSRTRRVIFSGRERRALALIAVSALLASWGYLIWRGV